MTQQATPPPAGTYAQPPVAPVHPSPVPPYGAPPGHASAPLPVMPVRTNGLAIGALVAAFLAPLLGVILGVVARGQIRRNGDGGRGLATAAIAIGAVLSALGLMFGVLVGMAVANAPTKAPADVVATEMASSLGLPAGSVTCPHELIGTPGNVMVCTATTPSGSVPVRATVTSSDSEAVHFDVLMG